MPSPKISKRQSYRWTGQARTGEKVSGTMEASGIPIVRAALRRQGIIPKKIRKETTALFGRSHKKITQADLTIVTRQLATMLAAGIPLIQSFHIIAKGQTNERMEKLLSDLKTHIEGGNTFAEALRQYPSYFNELFCNLVDAGEQSGTLDVMLAKLATYKEKIEIIKRKIKKALFYPAAVLTVAFLVTAALLIFVVPQFESLFRGFGADLPMMTRMVVSMSEFFQSYWWLIFGVLMGIIFGFTYGRKRSHKFSTLIDRVSLKLPIVGVVLEKAAIARFARTLSITFAAGLPLVDALKSVAGATGNILFAEATHKIREEVSTGQPMNVAMKARQLFPPMAVQMVAIGEESGTLEQMLSKIADFYEGEVDDAVDALSTLLEPVIMAILGVLVGGLVVAMYLPIFKLGSVI